MIRPNYAIAANNLLALNQLPPLTPAQAVLVQYWCDKQNKNLITAVYYASNLEIKLGDLEEVKTVPDVPDDIVAEAIKAAADVEAELVAADIEAESDEKENAPDAIASEAPATKKSRKR